MNRINRLLASSIDMVMDSTCVDSQDETVLVYDPIGARYVKFGNPKKFVTEFGSSRHCVRVVDGRYRMIYLRETLFVLKTELGAHNL